ncbi:helix-turn-helix domain-containing protein [Archangium sp.]|uniref:helix-turn-helix domain-containing protein n=1 Tax=Archangium sp. TaxID=1872627 RepID=UPI002D32365E|nr:helix-turn-helix domain-containing protein [Archangium sp.]HYO59766.1 helix-turn-helix domain-containing protein [Archangium sp.]
MRSSSPPAQDASGHLQGLARRIRGLRERRGLTQEDFAARCGISVSFASLLERGERSPSYETLVQVAAALGVPLAEFFQAEEDEAAGARRLVEFARARRLTRAEVDRLLAVAEAMFGGERAPGETPAEEAPRCKEPDCGRPVLARELCVAHYHRARRAKTGRASP